MNDPISREVGALATPASGDAGTPETGTTSGALAFTSRLRFVTRKRRRGGIWGERRSTRRGAGLEFADYRDYAPGDDPRRVDWNLYARLDRPYVRLYEEEEDLAVHVLVDGSASMACLVDLPVDAGESQRWEAARALAAALGAIALFGGDALSGALLGNGAVAATWGPGRGRVQLARWQTWCGHMAASGGTLLAPALRDFAARAGRPGLILLISDGYDPAGLAEGVAALAGRGHEVVLLHLLVDDELDPTIHGDLCLVDSETGDKREITIDAAALAAYRQRLESWQAELRALANKHGGRYALLRADAPLRKMVMEDLRSAGVVR
ncbi:MAG: DUF58 domain-containing protein [Anaerolineae bacterium]|nr:DUF58 domain-containing protein [Anaerolineae bacterium]